VRVLRSDDLVITPTGRRALVRVVTEEGFVHLLYLDSSELGTVHERLLRRLRPGQEDPPPVRIDADGRVR
jgi:hypothetical protein